MKPISLKPLSLLRASWKLACSLLCLGLGAPSILGQTTPPYAQGGTLLGPSDPVSNALSPFWEHVKALLFTAAQWEQKGDFARACQITQQTLAYCENEKTKDSIRRAVTMAARMTPSEASASGSGRGRDVTADAVKRALSFMHGAANSVKAYLGHLLCMEGQYRKALEQFEAVWSDLWRDDPRVLSTGDRYALDVYMSPLPVFRYELDAALCYYKLGEYAKAMLCYCVGIRRRNGNRLDAYGQKMQEHPELVGPKELGAVILMAEGVNVLGDGTEQIPLRGPLDPRYDFNWDRALEYTEEAYKLMPNNLDVCQQYCVLLYALKHYMQVIDVYEYMYSLIKKGPSAYVTAQTNFSLNNINVAVPKSCWEAWKRKHPGQETFYLPYWEDK
jgi:tetratricopeptide (TPR) repeat protein